MPSERIVGHVVLILIAWTPAIVALITIIRQTKKDAQQKLIINVEHEQDGKYLKEIVMEHTQQIKELSSPDVVKDMTVLKTTVSRHDDEIKRLEIQHNACVLKQNEIQGKIFSKLDELTEKIDNKFSELTKQIIDIYKDKK